MSSRERARVLFVDDQERARQLFLRAVDTDTFEARAAASVPEGEALIETWRPDVIVTDLRMPDVDGLEGLQRFRRLLPEVPVIVVTAFGTVETAVESMRRGAFDYLSKPFEQDQIEMVMTRALRHRALLAENARLRTELAARDQDQSQGQGGVVGCSRAIAQAVALVNRVAPTDYPVLIQGESGTGKDVFARLIHERSARSARPFVSLNCAAIPENLLESELFGYEKGAFSGAVSARAGFFERADGGTLFLDEIGDMSVNLQPKLLRVLQDGEYYPVGSRKPSRTDVRLIAASNQNIPARVESGQFRQDLYYRINTVRIVLPPLRERPEDIDPLARHFLAALSRKNLPFPPPRAFSPEALDRLVHHAWPGNVRELAHVIEHAALLCDGDVIEASHLPPEFQDGGGGPARRAPAPTPGPAGHVAEAAPPDPAADPQAPFDGTIASFQDARRVFEERYFVQLLEAHGGNVQRAAEAAGLHRTTLYERLAKLGLTPKVSGTGG
jgi:two-component system response regulator HydG